MAIKTTQASEVKTVKKNHLHSKSSERNILRKHRAENVKNTFQMEALLSSLDGVTIVTEGSKIMWRLGKYTLSTNKAFKLFGAKLENSKLTNKPLSYYMLNIDYNKINVSMFVK